MSENTETWEIKDRHYYLTMGKTPLTYTLASKHTQRFPLLYFDEEKGYNRELRYATNQKSVFVDEQQGASTLAHIIFKDGGLYVPKEKQNLQKLLSLYHPQKGKRYAEQDDVQEAKNELVDIEIEFMALEAARTIEIEHAEAILRVEYGSSVSNLTSSEIKRDLYIFAKKNPKLFLDLVGDENVKLRNFAIKATEAGIIKLSDDQRTFKWGSNGRKLMTVPFDEHPYSAFAAYLKTDEGLEVYKTMEKKMS
tara:strand:- start:27572 stop:28324 length:753 start_codon:yes stop_codon:yes gene_type:complete